MKVVGEGSEQRRLVKVAFSPFFIISKDLLQVTPDLPEVHK